MITAQNILVSHVTSKGMAFGFTTDGVSVYIPKRVAETAGVVEFATYSAQLVPNAWRPENAPLMAVMIHPKVLPLEAMDAPVQPLPEPGPVVVDPAPVVEVQPEPVAEPLPVAEKADEGVEHNSRDITRIARIRVMDGSVWTVGALISSICAETGLKPCSNQNGKVHMSLMREFKAGNLARAEIYRPGRLDAAASVRWAADWRSL